MNPSYHHIGTRLLSLTFENWMQILKTPYEERPYYKIDQGRLEFGQVIARFLGVPQDRDDYYNNLFAQVHDDESVLSLLSVDNLDKFIENQHFQSLQKVLQMHQEQNLSINRFVAFLDGEQLLLKSTNGALHRKLREALIITLKNFEENEQKGLHAQDFRRVLVDMIKWSFNHMQPKLNDMELKGTFTLPKFMWYGTFSKSHKYFIHYLANIGCDLVIYHPNAQDILADYSINNEHPFLHKYPCEEEPESFPKELRNRKSTVAYRASREIETILNHEGSGLYKPWQLREYIPSSLTLKTTYDELFILTKELAMIRPNFEVKNGHVLIPTVFAKILGVSRNRKEYWDRLHTLMEREECLLINQFPFTKEVHNDFRFHYRDAMNREGKLSPEKIMNSNYWRFGHLSTGLQTGIATAIVSMCEHPLLKPLPKEGLEEVQLYLFTQCMVIPEDILRLLQRFDYSQEVPKLILYNNELNGTMSRSDAAILLLLNRFGTDIIIYNPPGHNDIENFASEQLFDMHWLEDVVFDLEYREPSIVKKLFRPGFLRNLKGD